MQSRVPPLRLAYLLSQYPAVNHVFMLREVRLLRRCGFDIHVFSISPPDRPWDAMTQAEREESAAADCIKKAGIARVVAAHLSTLLRRPAAYFRGLSCALGTGGILYGFFYFTEALVVGHSMARLKLDHLHTHFASTVALIVARTFPVTMSATFHGPAEFDSPGTFRLREKVDVSLFSCAISRYGLSQLMRFGSSAQRMKLELTPLGVDPSEFAPRPFRPAPSPFQMLCVGRLAPVKGLYVLLAAVDMLVRQGHDVVLRFAGDGPERAGLENEAAAHGLKDHVFFAGNVNQDKLRNLYGDCDVLLLPSFGEGLPVVLMEAMAMEIPCVATWVAGIPELIRDGVDGLLVPPADECSLAEAILRLKDNPEFRLALGQAGRRRVLEGYDVNRNVERLAGVFRRRLAALPG